MEKRGLSEKEAKELLEKYGPNEIEEKDKKTVFKIFFNQIKNNFLVYFLLIAAIISFFIEEKIAGYTILIIIFIVITTGFIQEYRAEKAIRALKGMLTPTTIVIRGGKEKEIPSREIVPGDILILRSGEKVPADCVILEEKNLLVNEAILTGESKEVEKKKPKTEEYKEENLLFMGSLIMQGRCIAKVLHTGSNTRFGRIAGMISITEKESPFQDKIKRLMKPLAILAITFSVLTGILLLINQNIDKHTITEVLVIVIAIMISAFPEGLPLVLTTALSVGAYRMAKKSAIVNRMSIIETLGETTVICSDKTGTITKGEMTVKKILADGNIYELTGEGYEGEGEFLKEGKKAILSKERVLNKLIETAVLCNDAIIERTEEDKNFRGIGSSTEISLLVMAAKAGVYKEDRKEERKEEIPFDSKRKLMSVLCEKEKERIVYTKGALEVILEKCKYIERKDGVFRLTEKEKRKILEINKKFTFESYRTLAFAYKKTKLKYIEEKDLIFLGVVAMEDPPKEGVREAIEECIKAGIKVKMITGDNKETALSIAKQINLKGGVIDGNELDRLTEEELSKIIDDISIFARVNPEHKLKIIKALKMKGEIVTMTGDGINDAPSIKEAHIGVAMGKRGTDVTREVADITLKDDNFVTILEAIKEGRTIFSNMQKFTAYQISINISQLMLIFLAVLLRLPTPLIALQILFMNMFSDEITAITLIFNPRSKDVISQKPRKKSEIITKPLILMITIVSFFISLSSLGVFYYFLQKENEIVARTITFATMVFFGITNAFNFRSFRQYSLNRSPFTNKHLVFASIIAIFFIITVVYNPFLNKIFETTPINPFYLFSGVLVSLSVLVIFDILKYINNKKNLWTEDVQDFVKKKS
ncbi:MAG: cation-transporting P-type ATPase [Candidatus Pacearchaeota archaeon]